MTQIMCLGTVSTCYDGYFEEFIGIQIVEGLGFIIRVV